MQFSYRKYFVPNTTMSTSYVIECNKHADINCAMTTKLQKKSKQTKFKTKY